MDSTGGSSDGTGFAPEVIQYGIDRYRNETRRLYRTMETQLKRSASGYLVGDRVTVADIACWGWVACSRTYLILPISFTEYLNLHLLSPTYLWQDKADHSVVT